MLEDMTLEDLKEWNQKVAKLLDDPHPGLYTWNSMLAHLMSQVQRRGA